MAPNPKIDWRRLAGERREQNRERRQLAASNDRIRLEVPDQPLDGEPFLGARRLDDGSLQLHQGAALGFWAQLAIPIAALGATAVLEATRWLSIPLAALWLLVVLPMVVLNDWEDLTRTWLFRRGWIERALRFPMPELVTPQRFAAVRYFEIIHRLHWGDDLGHDDELRFTTSAGRSVLIKRLAVREHESTARLRGPEFRTTTDRDIKLEIHSEILGFALTAANLVGVPLFVRESKTRIIED